MMRLLICGSCMASVSPNQDHQFRADVAAAIDEAGLADTIAVERGPCMGSCETPITIALQGHDRASYVFSGIKPDQDIPDIINTCRLYADSPGGQILDARPCGRLRHCLRANIPPFIQP